MKRMSSVFGALLVFGLVGALSGPAAADGQGYGNGNGRNYNNDCNCDGPVVRVINAGTQVVTSHRTVRTNRVVPRVVRVEDKNRVIVHQRTVLHRNVVTHRNNTENRNIVVRRINTAHKFRTVHKNQTVHRRVNTNTTSRGVRTVRGRDCNCAPGQSGYRGMSYWRKNGAVSARN